jgi:hypothetical protein
MIPTWAAAGFVSAVPVPHPDAVWARPAARDVALVQTRRLEADDIGPRAAVMTILAEGVVDEVVPLPSPDDVVPAIRARAFEVVAPAAASDEVVAVVAAGDVSPRPAEDVIVALTPEEAVLAISSAKDVVTVESPKLVVATEATDHIPAVGSPQHIVSMCAPDRAWLPIR